MKKLVVLALLAAGHMCSPVEAKQDFSCNDRKACCNPKRLPEPVSGLITITESGAYKLTKCITSDIFIDANDVCLDLNCFTLTGTGNNNFYAIEADDHTNITIKNGTIKNPGLGGIGLFGCSQLHLEGLKLNPVDIAIDINQGIVETSHGCLKDIDVSGNNTLGGTMIIIQNGHTFSLTNIDASDCIINRASTVVRGFVDIFGVKNVTMSCCKISNNECQDTILFVPLKIQDEDNISVEDTTVNDNKVTNQGLSAGMVDAFFGFGTNYSIKRCQFNGSTVNQSTFCYGLFAQLTTDLFIDCCEANGTTLKIAVPGSVLDFGPIASGATGIFVVGSGFLEGSAEIFKILNSEANGTTHLFNQPFQEEFSGPEGIFLLGAVQGTVGKCQANHTKVVKGEPFLACGIAVSFSRDIKVCASEVLDTIVKPAGNGQAFGFATFMPNLDISYLNCTSNGATADTFAVGFVTLRDFVNNDPRPNTNISYKNCCAKNNHASFQGFGFAFSGDTNNLSVSDSQAQGNTTAGIQIGFSGDTHTNPNIKRNCAEKNGAGFVVEGTGTSILNPLLLDNKAIKNSLCGFVQNGTVSNSTYKGNKAQGNLPDFCNFINIDGNKTVKGKLTCKDN